MTEHPRWRQAQLDNLRKLKGKTVKAVGYDSSAPHPDDDFMCLIFTDGTQAWVLRDPEGNGPGHLDIQEVTTP